MACARAVCPAVRRVIPDVERRCVLGTRGASSGDAVSLVRDAVWPIGRAIQILNLAAARALILACGEMKEGLCRHRYRVEASTHLRDNSCSRVRANRQARRRPLLLSPAAEATPLQCRLRKNVRSTDPPHIPAFWRVLTSFERRTK